MCVRVLYVCVSYVFIYMWKIGIVIMHLYKRIYESTNKKKKNKIKKKK